MTSRNVFISFCCVVIVFLQSYGWFVVLGLAVAFYFKGYIEQTFSRWHSSRHQETDYHRYGTVSHFLCGVCHCFDGIQMLL